MGWWLTFSIHYWQIIVPFTWSGRLLTWTISIPDPLSIRVRWELRPEVESKIIISHEDTDDG